MSEPREFGLIGEGAYKNPIVVLGPALIEGECLRVIELSAFTAIQNENSTLKSRIEKLREGHKEIIKKVMSMDLYLYHLIAGIKAISSAALKADEEAGE